jgi:branched-subunit amino acid transport protein
VTTWWTIGGLAAATIALKAIGPVALGGRTLPPAFLRVVSLMAAALLAALVVTNVLTDGRHLAVGAQTVGVVAGGAVAWRTRSVVLAAAVAVVVTAALRAVF